MLLATLLRDNAKAMIVTPVKRCLNVAFFRRPPEIEIGEIELRRAKVCLGGVDDLFCRHVDWLRRVRLDRFLGAPSRRAVVFILGWRGSAAEIGDGIV
jgi:hypothetical protein